MKDHKIQVRVRYSETDQMGVVYHGNYIPYFEMGRVEWLRNKGVSYKSMEENGILCYKIFQPVSSIVPFDGEGSLLLAKYS